MGLEDMFLHTVIEKPEYMKVNYKYFPEDIRKSYNLGKYEIVMFVTEIKLNHNS